MERRKQSQNPAALVTTIHQAHWHFKVRGDPDHTPPAAGNGVGDYLMGAGPDRIRFIGHGVGLELDEFPFLADGQTTKLHEGRVIALESKLIFPGKGVVGIENTHVVAPSRL